MYNLVIFLTLKKSLLLVLWWLHSASSLLAAGMNDVHVSQAISYHQGFREFSSSPIFYQWQGASFSLLLQHRQLVGPLWKQPLSFYCGLKSFRLVVCEFLLWRFCLFLLYFLFGCFILFLSYFQFLSFLRPLIILRKVSKSDWLVSFA